MATITSTISNSSVKNNSSSNTRAQENVVDKLSLIFTFMKIILKYILVYNFSFCHYDGLVISNVLFSA
jgi:hypothetical protein